MEEDTKRREREFQEEPKQENVPLDVVRLIDRILIHGTKFKRIALQLEDQDELTVVKIRKAYHKVLQRIHPDRVPLLRATDALVIVNDAYRELLADRK